MSKKKLYSCSDLGYTVQCKQRPRSHQWACHPRIGKQKIICQHGNIQTTSLIPCRFQHRRWIWANWLIFAQRLQRTHNASCRTEMARCKSERRPLCSPYSAAAFSQSLVNNTWEELIPRNVCANLPVPMITAQVRDKQIRIWKYFGNFLHQRPTTSQC